MTTVDPEVIAEFFRYVDRDGDGIISVEEIKDACAVDIDGDGVVSEDERLQCARVWLNDKLPQQDADGDRRISLQELMAYAPAAQ